MRPVLASLLLLGTLAAASGVIPADYGDGVWVFLANETEPRLVETIEMAKKSARASVAALPDPDSHCNDYSVNTGDMAFARINFNSQLDLGNYYATGAKIWSTYDSAVAYMCVYGGSQRGWSDEYTTAMNLVDLICTDKGAGWTHITAYQKAYGRSNAGVSIC